MDAAESLPSPVTRVVQAPFSFTMRTMDEVVARRSEPVPSYREVTLKESEVSAFRRSREATMRARPSSVAGVGAAAGASGVAS